MKKTRRILATLVALTALIGAQSALAASDSKNLTIGASVGGLAKLTLGSAGINFPSADPDTTPSISATENPVSVTSKVRGLAADNTTLTVLAGGDLLDGAKTIPVNNVTWTSTGANYVDGTMNKTTGQSAGAFTGPGTFSGNFSYFLANSWSFEPGTYTATVTYTLTSP